MDLLPGRRRKERHGEAESDARIRRQLVDHLEEGAAGVEERRHGGKVVGDGQRRGRSGASEGTQLPGGARVRSEDGIDRNGHLEK